MAVADVEVIICCPKQHFIDDVEEQCEACGRPIYMRPYMQPLAGERKRALCVKCASSTVAEEDQIVFPPRVCEELRKMGLSDGDIERRRKEIERELKEGEKKQQWLCRKCGAQFTNSSNRLKKFRYDSIVVLDALRQKEYGFSHDQILRYLADKYNVEIARTTISQWYRDKRTLLQNIMRDNPADYRTIPPLGPLDQARGHRCKTADAATLAERTTNSKLMWEKRAQGYINENRKRIEEELTVTEAFKELGVSAKRYNDFKKLLTELNVTPIRYKRPHKDTSTTNNTQATIDAEKKSYPEGPGEVEKKIREYLTMHPEAIRLSKTKILEAVGFHDSGARGRIWNKMKKEFREQRKTADEKQQPPAFISTGKTEAVEKDEEKTTRRRCLSCGSPYMGVKGQTQCPDCDEMDTSPPVPIKPRKSDISMRRNAEKEGEPTEDNLNKPAKAPSSSQMPPTIKVPGFERLAGRLLIGDRVVCAPKKAWIDFDVCRGCPSRVGIKTLEDGKNVVLCDKKTEEEDA